MPRKKSPKQDFIPLTEAKQTVEIEVKPRPTTQEIEKVESSPKKRKRKKIQKELNGDSLLIITEKPQAASKISAGLSDGKARQIKAGAGVYYYQFNKDGKDIIVACAVGHLFSLSQDVKGSNYPIFDISWKPNFEVRKKDFTKKYYNNIKRLVKKAKEIIVATDYDVEGEVIGYNIVRFLANQPDAKRMKFSSLTSKELEKSYKNINEHIDWGQAIAGETRHYLDWFYGINLSRALMNSIKSAGRFKIMSIGRVQGPALNLIVQKEKTIQSFKPETFWRVFLDLVDKKDKNNKVQVKYVKDVKDKKELDKFKKLKGKEADVKTKKAEQILPPPPPFDLTTLQTESYKFFSLTPARTLQIAQQLYLAGIISYPRTSSQKIPEGVDVKTILKRLEDKFKETRFVTKEKPVEGKKSDPAHPAIHPTGEFQTLSGDEKKIYELIVKRFIACFCDDAKIENKTITAEIDDLVFKAKGLEVKEKAWMQVYSTKLQEKELKDMDGKAKIEKVDIQEDETKPPKRYSPASIIKELEKRGLGTKATRAHIIETLYNRGYIIDIKAIRATPLGINLIDSLEKHSPIIIEEKLTKEIEKDMEKMQTDVKKERLEKKQQEVLEKSKDTLSKISEKFHKDEKKIGKDLVKAVEASWKQEQKDNEIGPCPVCKKGMLTKKYSPKNKKYFIACNAYPKCKTTFSLPPYGFIKKTEKKCEYCGFPILMSIRKGKKPWFFCFNPECPEKKQRQETENKKED